jgi:hypothetical protein
VVVVGAVDAAADDDTVDIESAFDVATVSGEVRGSGDILSGLTPPAVLTTTGNGSVCEWVAGERRVGGVCHP